MKWFLNFQSFKSNSQNENVPKEILQNREKKLKK